MALDVSVGGVAAVGTMVETWRMIMNHLADYDNSENRPSDRNIAGVGRAAYFLGVGSACSFCRAGCPSQMSRMMMVGTGGISKTDEFFGKVPNGL